MPEKTWRQRFDKAVKRDGRSLRAISKASGLAETALWEILNTEKEPGIGKLLAICTELRVSISYILEGGCRLLAGSYALCAWVRRQPTLALGEPQRILRARKKINYLSSLRLPSPLALQEVEKGFLLLF